jgi:hypothetical protein
MTSSSYSTAGEDLTPEVDFLKLGKYLYQDYI